MLMKRWYKIVLIGSIFTGLLGGCAKEQTELLPMPTVMPDASVTATLTPTAMPDASVTATLAPTAVSEGKVAIIEDNFGDVRFCNYLKEKYDDDGDGFLSEAERNAVTEFRLHPTRFMLEPYTSLKGFSYFPKMETLELNSVKSIEICNLPKLKSISWSGQNSVQVMKIGDVTIKDCPLLEEIRLEDALFIGGSEAEISKVVVENCPAADWLFLKGADMKKVSLEASGAPLLRVSVIADENGDWTGEMVLESSNTLQMRPMPLLNVVEKKIVMDKMNVTWKGKALSFEQPVQELEHMIREVQNGFSVEVQEVIPELCDDAGRKAYSVRLESAQLASDHYMLSALGLESYKELREKYEYYYDSLVMYVEQEPTQDQFSFEWGEDVLLQISEYSQEKGMCGAIWENSEYGVSGKLVYSDGNGKEEIGLIMPFLYYSITEEGLTIRTDEVWEPEAGKYDTKAAGREAEQLAEGDILICKENFSNILFRDYLREELDVDHNGVLSREERETVTLIDLTQRAMGADVLDGFGYFPNLESIYLEPCRKISCVDCPELLDIEIFGDGEETEVEVENCPRLEKINKDAYWGCEGGIM